MRSFVETIVSPQDETIERIVFLPAVQAGSTVSIIISILSACFLSGCAYLGYLKDPFYDIPNLRQVNPQLYRGGEPKKLGWDKLKSLGIKSIVNLEEKRPGDSNEKRTAESLGIKVYCLPLSLYSVPSEEQVLMFLGIVLTPDNQPVFIHCNNGRDRTGVMIAMYRVVVNGWTIKDAYGEATSLGYWPYYGEDAPLKKFIHQLKDKKNYFEKIGELKNEPPK
mgnify:CR=1 FL=1